MTVSGIFSDVSRYCRILLDCGWCNSILMKAWNWLDFIVILTALSSDLLSPTMGSSCDTQCHMAAFQLVSCLH